MAKKVFTDTTWTEFTDNMSILSGKVKNTNIAYGTCSTAAGTAAKVVTLSDNSNWQLAVGSIITVKFTNTNTASSPTLNVNSTGAKPIYYNNEVYTDDGSYGGYAKRHITYQYDGSNWVFVSWSYDSNSDTKVTQTVRTTDGEFPVLLRGTSAGTSTTTTTTSFGTKIKANPSTGVLTATTFKGALDGNATSATTATSASQATKDASGNTITSTYETKTDATSKLDEAKAYTDTVASGKSNTGHTHSISNVTDLQSSLDAKVPTSRTVNGKALSSDISLTASDVGAATSGHTHSSYVNQNAFSNVKVGTTTVAADTATDTLEIAAGTGISVAGDATNDKVTITNSGVRSIATGSSNGTISVNTNGTSENVAVKGLGSAAYTASTAYDAAGTATTKADAALASAKSYTDTAISNLINSAPTTLDTLGEIADAMAENADVVSALDEAVGKKVDKVDGKGLSTNDFTTAYKEKLDGIASGANNYTLPTASSTLGGVKTTSTVTSTSGLTACPIISGVPYYKDTNTTYTNVKLGQGYGTCSTAESTTAKVVTLSSYTLATGGIVAVKFTYAVPASATMDINSKGAKNIYYRGTAITAGVIKAGDIATFMYDGTQYQLLTVDRDENTTYSLSSFGITATAAELNKLDGVTATTTELNYVDGVTSNIQTQLNGKQATVTGAATTITGSNLTASRALISNSSGKVAVSAVTSTELGYLDGVTSAIQTQLDGKAPTSHASSATTYGAGTDSNYGHVKLSDSTSSTSSTSGGIAATPAAVKAAYDLANGKANASHNHSGSNITSGTVDAARLPVASSSASGIVNTSSQTFAGAKTFSNQITASGGISTGGSIIGDTANAYDIGSGSMPFDITYTKTLNVSPQNVSGSTILGGSFSTTTQGTTTTDGFTELKVGNAVASGKNGNAQGLIQIYNSSSGSVTLQCGHSTSTDYRVYLPSSGGTLATNSTFVKSGSDAKAGLVPAPSTTAGTTKYLREDGTWAVPPDTNTTYSNATLGCGYGTCSTAASTKAKVVTLSSYALVTGGIVSVKFTYGVPASATMNINSKGAKSIYYRGAAIKADVIKAGDVATFIYNGSQYHLLTIDRCFTDVRKTWVDTVSGYHIDKTYSELGLISGAVYAITVNNVNRDASLVVVTGCSINEAKNSVRIYFDNTYSAHSCQFSMYATQI